MRNLQIKLSFVILGVAFFALFNIACGSTFPSIITKCLIKDDVCLAEQATKFIRACEVGVPQFNIPSLEPLKLNKIEILQDQTSAAKINLILTNLEIHNFTKGTVLSVRGFTKDVSKPMKVRLESYNPKITVKGHYKISGNVLILPISGEGYIEMVLTDVTHKSKAIIKPLPLNGKTHLTVDELKLQTKPKNARINMTNLFNGDKALSENMLALINENWELLGDDLTPKIDEGIASVEKDILEKIFKDAAYDDNFFLPEE